MNRPGIMITTFLICLFMAGQALATKPGEEVNPNGFPSGPHYNLNIHGKKNGFNCPEPTMDENGDLGYGHVIFVPENGRDIQVLMQSGKGKWASLITDLEVTDVCTSAFDGDAAVLQLPHNELGYRVYARPLAKPTNDPSIAVTPKLQAVVDEYGNDLIYLGLVNDQGFETPYESFTRKKGKSRAVDITGLFEWTGDVCYFSEPATGSGYQMDLCCTTDAEGLYDLCQSPNPDTGQCDAGSLVTLYCNHYEDEWVFNIADFVEYLWSMDNNGVKLLQIRFYPVSR